MPQETYGVIIHQIHNTIEKSLNNQLRRKGITLSQMNVLITLVASPKKKLSFKEDKRIKSVEITELGIKYCEDAETEVNSIEEQIVSCLSETERETFLSLLKKVNNTLMKI